MQFIATGAEFRIDTGGSMTIIGKNMIEKSTLLHADDGQIKLNQNFINRNYMIVAHQLIDIGYGTTIGPNVCIYDHDHDKSNGGGFKSVPVHIGSNVWIGANSVILKDVTIGDNAVIGAGTVITHDVACNATIVRANNRRIR